MVVWICLVLRLSFDRGVCSTVSAAASVLPSPGFSVVYPFRFPPPAPSQSVYWPPVSVPVSFGFGSVAGVSGSGSQIYQSFGQQVSQSSFPHQWMLGGPVLLFQNVSAPVVYSVGVEVGAGIGLGVAQLMVGSGVPEVQASVPSFSVSGWSVCYSAVVFGPFFGSGVG